jgi:hypothetical protein
MHIGKIAVKKFEYWYQWLDGFSEMILCAFPESTERTEQGSDAEYHRLITPRIVYCLFDWSKLSISYSLVLFLYFWNVNIAFF